MLRSIERQKQYKQRVIEAARIKKETGKDIVIEQEDSNKERDIERILKYRCEQMSATRLMVFLLIILRLIKILR